MREHKLHWGHRGHRHGGHREERVYGERDNRRDRGSDSARRRGRASAFLDYLNVKRSTLVQQLAQPEYEAIKPVISGELKAVDAIIEQYIHWFELGGIEAASVKEKNKTAEGDEASDDPA